MARDDGERVSYWRASLFCALGLLWPLAVLVPRRCKKALDTTSDKV